MKKRILSILLTLCMVLALVPATAFAEEGYYTITQSFKYGAYQCSSIKVETSPYTHEETAIATFSLGDVEDCAPYKFVGWKETGSGTVYEPYASILPESDLTFEAVYEVDGGLTVTVEGFEVGNTPADCEYTFESTIPDVTFSADDIRATSWFKYVFDGTRYIWYPIIKTEVFEAGTRYKCLIQMNNNGLELAPAVTMNGNTPESCLIMTKGGNPVGIEFTCELGTPPAEPEPVITLTVPFTTTVKQGGNVAPGETTFDLALIGDSLTDPDEDKSDVTITGSVTTNGKGSYNGTLTITGPEQTLWHMFSEGAFVQQVNAGEANWTYDDTVWGVLMDEIPVAYAMSDDAAASKYTVYVVPASIDGQGNYYIDWDNLQKEAMTFTNIYTKSVFEPAEPTESDPDLPQTGDNSSMILRVALLLISGSAVIGMIAAGKKRKYNRG